MKRAARLALAGLAVALLTSAPYLRWWATVPAGSVPLGNDLSNLADLYTYLAWMRQAQDGHLLFINLYSGDPQPRVLFLPFFLVLGRAAAFLSLPNLLVLHAARAAGAVALLGAAAWLCRLMAADPARRRLAFWLLALGSGLPGFFPEASPISSMYDSALLTWSWVLLLLGASCWLRALRDGWEPGAALAGLLATALFLVHPYDGVSLVAVVTTTAVAMAGGSGRVTARRWGIALAAAAPGAALAMGSILASPTLAAWARHPRPTRGWELLSFGTIGILALLRVLRRPRCDAFASVWAATSLLLMLAPLPSQRRYIQGLQAPLCVLAADGFAVLVASTSRWHGHVARLLLVAAFPAPAVMLASDMTNIVDVRRYVARSLVEDLEGLSGAPEGVILAPPYIDLLVPAFSGRQVYAGHLELTPDHEEKSTLWLELYGGRLDGSELAARGIGLVLVPRLPDPLRSYPGLSEVRSMKTLRLLRVERP